MSPASTVDRFAARARAARRRPRMLLLAVLAAVVLVGLVTWVVRFSTLLAVDDVRVVGASGDLAGAVRQAAAAPTGKPLAGVDLTATGRRVAELPAVEKVRVAREWPHTLLVDVTERVPVVAVKEGNGVRLLDAHAVGYATAPQAPDGVPVVDAAQTADPVALQGVVTTMAALPADLRSTVSGLTVKSASAISFTVGRTAVRWGDASRPELKVKILRALLAEKPNGIDVTAPQAPATF